MTFKSNTVYRLKDPERYDDEYGVGFDRIETYGDCDGMFITDCWVVNSEGDIHPGYESSPMPVRYDDVEPDAIGPGTNGDRFRSTAMWA